MMNLELTWTAPTPAPTCGYKALYKRKADPSYTEIDTSGTSTTIAVSAPTCYDGLLVSDCCSGNVAPGTPFGLNAYSTFSCSGDLNEVRAVLIHVNAPYANPYALLIEGRYTITVNLHAVNHPFSLTFPANSTDTYTVVSSPYPVGAVVSDVTITYYAPVFNNGGSIQQLDPVNTPSYFQFYADGESSPTWDGAPISLPSFTLDRFVVTELDVNLITVLAGRLEISYILSENYMTSFTSLELEVYDGATLIGSVFINTNPLGARTTSINLVKGPSTLSSSTEFQMVAVWPDTTIIATKSFYLPTF